MEGLAKFWLNFLQSCVSCKLIHNNDAINCIFVSKTKSTKTSFKILE